MPRGVYFNKLQLHEDFSGFYNNSTKVKKFCKSHYILQFLFKPNYSKLLYHLNSDTNNITVAHIDKHINVWINKSQTFNYIYILFYKYLKEKNLYLNSINCHIQRVSKFYDL